MKNREEGLRYRFGSSTSARVAIPLGAALVAAIVLPALLLQTHDSVTLPVAAPSATESRIVHTQTQPEPVPKHRATAKRAKRAGGATARVTPLASPQSSPASSGRAKAHPEHAPAQAQRAAKNAKTIRTQGKATRTHGNAAHTHGNATRKRGNATRKHVPARQPHVAAATTLTQQAASGQSAARQHKSKPKHNIHAKKVHKAHGTAPHPHQQHEPNEHANKPHGKGKS